MAVRRIDKIILLSNLLVRCLKMNEEEKLITMDKELIKRLLNCFTFRNLKGARKN